MRRANETAKNYWEEACFIPDSNDQQKVLAVTKRFLALQDDDLNVGVVYREFVPFAPLALHSKSGMPLTREYRAFVKDGRSSACSSTGKKVNMTLIYLTPKFFGPK